MNAGSNALRKCDVPPRDSVPHREGRPRDSVPRREGRPRDNVPRREGRPRDNVPRRDGRPRESALRRAGLPKKSKKNVRHVPSHLGVKGKLLFSSDQDQTGKGLAVLPLFRRHMCLQSVGARKKGGHEALPPQRHDRRLTGS